MLNPVEARVVSDWLQRLKLNYDEVLRTFAFNQLAPLVTEDVAAAEVAASRRRAAADAARRGSLMRHGLCEPSAASLGLAALVAVVVALVSVAGRRWRGI